MTSNGQGAAPRTAAGGPARRGLAAARGRHAVGPWRGELAVASARASAAATTVPHERARHRDSTPATAAPGREGWAWRDSAAVDWVREAIQETFR